MSTRSRLAAAILAAIFPILIVGNVLAQDASASAAPAQSAQAPAQAQAPAGSADAAQVPQAETGVNWPGAGYGAAALFGNVLYIPAKLTYAILGGLVGGGTWLVTAGNTQAADTVWRSCLGGDYVLTPQMVAGQQPINFSGPTETPPPAPPAAPDQTASSGSVQPIAPLPPVGASSPAAAATAAPDTAASSNGMHPLDAGSGPVNSKGGSGSSIE